MSPPFGASRRAVQPSSMLWGCHPWRFLSSLSPTWCCSRAALHRCTSSSRGIARWSMRRSRRSVVIAMVTVRPEHGDEMGGDPPIYDVGCAGFIQNYQKLADGRYNLVLQGTHRVRIESETPTTPERLYRAGHVISLEDPLHDARKCAQLREKVVDQLCKIVEFTSELSVEEAVGQFQDMDPASFTDGVCQSLGLPRCRETGFVGSRQHRRPTRSTRKCLGLPPCNARTRRYQRRRTDPGPLNAWPRLLFSSPSLRVEPAKGTHSGHW